MVMKFKSLKFNKIAVLLVGILLVITFSGCQQEEAKNEIKIFAASSLTESVTDICQLYETSCQNTCLTVNFAGSKTLRTQIENGAPADIFVSANEKHYKALLEQGLIKEGRKLLVNEMVLVVSNEASDKICSLEDLSKPHLLILADEGVPAGDYGRKVISNLNEVYGEDYSDQVLNNLASSENNVRQVLTKIALGEGDAAMVYKTDITEDMAGQVKVIEIPTDHNVIASYWIGIINNDKIAESVSDCFDYFSKTESNKIFERYGFTVIE